MLPEKGSGESCYCYAFLWLLRLMSRPGFSRSSREKEKWVLKMAFRTKHQPLKFPLYCLYCNLKQIRPNPRAEPGPFLSGSLSSPYPQHLERQRRSAALSFPSSLGWTSTLVRHLCFLPMSWTQVCKETSQTRLRAWDLQSRQSPATCFAWSAVQMCGFPCNRMAWLLTQTSCLSGTAWLILSKEPHIQILWSGKVWDC